MSGESNPGAGPVGAGQETVLPDDTRMSIPSPRDVSEGKAKPMVWEPDPSARPPDARPRDEYDAREALGPIASALGLSQAAIDGTRLQLADRLPFSSEQLADMDARHQVEAERELRSLWGDMFDANLVTVNKFLDTLPASAGDVFRNGRRTDGRALANTPAEVQRILGAARNRGSFVLPEGDAATKIAAIEAIMGTKTYVRDELLQATYRDLLRQVS